MSAQSNQPRAADERMRFGGREVCWSPLTGIVTSRGGSLKLYVR
jgi:hypothetical protein